MSNDSFNPPKPTGDFSDVNEFLGWLGGALEATTNQPTETDLDDGSLGSDETAAPKSVEREHSPDALVIACRLDSRDPLRVFVAAAIPDGWEVVGRIDECNCANTGGSCTGSQLIFDPAVDPYLLGQAALRHKREANLALKLMQQYLRQNETLEKKITLLEMKLRVLTPRI
jgi:hypothetical protein